MARYFTRQAEASKQVHPCDTDDPPVHKSVASVEEFAAEDPVQRHQTGKASLQTRPALTSRMFSLASASSSGSASSSAARRPQEEAVKPMSTIVPAPATDGAAASSRSSTSGYLHRVFKERICRSRTKGVATGEPSAGGPSDQHQQVGAGAKDVAERSFASADSMSRATTHARGATGSGTSSATGSSEQATSKPPMDSPVAPLPGSCENVHDVAESNSSPQGSEKDSFALWDIELQDIAEAGRFCKCGVANITGEAGAKPTTSVKMGKQSSLTDTRSLSCSTATPSAAGTATFDSLDIQQVATLVPVLPHLFDTACQTLEDLRATSASTSRIAILSDPEGLPQDLDLVRAVQKKLLACGADMVLWKGPGIARLQADISMALVQIEENDRVRNESEHRLKEKHARELADALKEQRKEAAPSGEPCMGLFWQSVHRTFAGFPKLDDKLPEAAVPGCRIGVCELEKVIGSGAFSSVYSAKNRETGRREAVKVLSKRTCQSTSDVLSIFKEYHYLSKLRHHNIIRLHGAMQGPRHIFVRMELAGDQTLFRALRSAGGAFGRDRARHCFAQLASAVAYCHKVGVAHRDIKPENIAVKSGSTTLEERLVLLDFGSSVACDKACNGVEGTMPFLAPEMHACVVTKELRYMPSGCDVWAMGVVALEMICGVESFSNALAWDRRRAPGAQCLADLASFVRDISKLTSMLRDGAGLADEELDTLMLGMYEIHPDERWTAQEVVESCWVRRAGYRPPAVSAATMPPNHTESEAEGHA